MTILIEGIEDNHIVVVCIAPAIGQHTEREEARKEALQKVEEIMTMARVRVQKQYEMSMELARATPGKMRQAAEVQATKTQEMPGMMMKTVRKGLDMGSLVVRYVTDQLSDDRDKKD